MQVAQLLTSGLCILLRCQFEFPSDPLQEQSSFPLISDRSGRDFEDNEISDFPRVSTNDGMLEGYTMTTIKGRKIFAFEGVPYAEDTGGANRFKPAIPKSNWTGVREAKEVGEKCIQLHLIHAMQLVGSENCLSLNVYTPKLPTRRKHPKLPVMVFIHGGSWYFGSGSEYGPSYLLEHDMILVTINYRLGLFGFLSTGDSVVPGNLGLKDQSLALKWVHKNIEAFGGDPSKITITGQSAGAASVHLHMMSKLSKGTFSQGISLSGNAFSSWAVVNSKSTAHVNKKIARASRCPRYPSEAFVSCLRKASPRRLATMILRVFDILVTPAVPLAAVIEPEAPGAFLTAHPDELYAKNAVAPVPWLCNRNLNETSGIFTALHAFGIRGQSMIGSRLWKSFAPMFLDYRFVATDPNIITDKVNEFYFKKAKIPTKGSIFSELSTDRLFGYGVHKSLQIHSQIAPTYSWLYGYQGRSSLIALTGQNPKNHGVSHTDDLAIYFNMSEFYPGYMTTDPEYAVVKLVTSLFANFLEKGEPLYTDDNGLTKRIWDPVTNPRDIHVLSINDQVKVIPEPHTDRYKFWESLGLADNKPFIPIE